MIDNKAMVHWREHFEALFMNNEVDVYQDQNAIDEVADVQIGIAEVQHAGNS